MTDTTSHPPATAARRDQALGAAQAAARAFHRASEAAEAAGRDLDDALATARGLRISWVQLAEATSLTTKQLQWRTLAAAEPEAVAAVKPRTGARPGRGPGVNIARAADLLGVSRTTVYARIAAGSLTTTTNELGQERVLGLED